MLFMKNVNWRISICEIYYRLIGGLFQTTQVKSSMTFFTTRTIDPDIIDKAKDLLQLLSLAVPASMVQMPHPFVIVSYLRP